MDGEHRSIVIVRFRYLLCCSGIYAPFLVGFVGLLQNEFLYCFAFFYIASILWLCEQCCFVVMWTVLLLWLCEQCCCCGYVNCAVLWLC